MYKSFLVFPLMFVLGGAPAFAKTTVIAELGTAPLLGTSRSTAEMRDEVARNEGVISAAAVRLGLTTGEYALFRTAIAQSHVAWVTLPRHLDAMTWQAGGRVYALHDVRIPAGTHGWEVDLQAHGQKLALYMPAKCGNLSLVRTAIPAIARHRAIPPAPVAVAAPVVPPPPAAPVAVAQAPVPPPDDTPAPAPVVAAPTEFPPADVPKHRPLFLAPLLFGLAALSGGSGTGPIVAPPVGCP